MGNRKVTVENREIYHRFYIIGRNSPQMYGFVSNSRGIGFCVSGTPSFVGQSDSYVSDFAPLLREVSATSYLRDPGFLAPL
jgi:hypothetical protein